MRAFVQCYALTSVSLSNQQNSIGDNAFLSCGELTSISIPNSVSKIGVEVFLECSKLTSVTINNSYVIQNFKTIFSTYRNLKNITLGVKIN